MPTNAGQGGSCEQIPFGSDGGMTHVKAECDAGKDLHLYKYDSTDGCVGSFETEAVPLKENTCLGLGVASIKYRCEPGLSAGAIAGIAVGSTLGFLLLCFLVKRFFFGPAAGSASSHGAQLGTDYLGSAKGGVPREVNNVTLETGQ